MSEKATDAPEEVPAVSMKMVGEGAEQKAEFSLAPVSVDEADLIWPKNDELRWKNTEFLVKTLETPFDQVSDEGRQRALKIVSNAALYSCGVTINPNGDDLFHMAARFGDAEIMSALLESSHLRPDRTNKDDLYPLHIAIMSGHAEVAKKLIWHDIELMKDTIFIPKSVVDESLTPYALAVMSHQFELSQWMELHVPKEAWDVSEIGTDHYIDTAIRGNNGRMFDYLMARYKPGYLPAVSSTFLSQALLPQVNNAMFDRVLDHPMIDARAGEVDAREDSRRLGKEPLLPTIISKTLESGDRHKFTRLLEAIEPERTGELITASEFKRIINHSIPDSGEQRAQTIALRQTMLGQLCAHGGNPNTGPDAGDSLAKKCMADSLHFFNASNDTMTNNFFAESLAFMMDRGMRVFPTDYNGEDVLVDGLSDEQLEDRFEGALASEWLRSGLRERSRNVKARIIEPYRDKVREDIAKLPKTCNAKLLLRAYAVGLEDELFSALAEHPQSGMKAFHTTPHWFQTMPQMQQQMTRLGAYAAHAHPGSAVRDWSVETLTEHAQGQGV